MTTQCFMLSSVASPRCFHVAKTYNFSSHLSFLPSGAELTLTIHMSLRLQYFIRNKFTTNSIWWFNLHIALSLLPNNNYSKLEFLTQLSKFCLNSVLIVPSGPHLWWLQHSSLCAVSPSYHQSRHQAQHLPTDFALSFFNICKILIFWGNFERKFVGSLN